MFRVWISLLALSIAAVWATAVASAQEPASLDFEDAALDAMPPVASAWADLVAGDVVLADDTLVATLHLTLLPEMQPGVAYAFMFHDGKHDWYMAAVTVPTLTFYYGGWADGPESAIETRGSYTAGPDGTVTIEMPLAALGNATALTGPRGGAYDIKPDATPIGGMLVLDEAAGEGELPLPAPEAPAEAEPTPAAVEEAAAPAAEEEPRAATPGFAPLLALAALALAARSR